MLTYVGGVYKQRMQANNTWKFGAGYYRSRTMSMKSTANSPECLKGRNLVFSRDNNKAYTGLRFLGMLPGTLPVRDINCLAVQTVQCLLNPWEARRKLRDWKKTQEP